MSKISILIKLAAKGNNFSIRKCLGSIESKDIQEALIKAVEEESIHTVRQLGQATNFDDLSSVIDSIDNDTPAAQTIIEIMGNMSDIS